MLSCNPGSSTCLVNSLTTPSSALISGLLLTRVLGEGHPTFFPSLVLNPGARKVPMFPSVLVTGTQGLTPLQLRGSSEPGTRRAQNHSRPCSVAQDSALFPSGAQSP